jgi:hypothetical protein
MPEEQGSAPFDKKKDKQQKVLLRMHDLQGVYGLVPATVYRWIAEGNFRGRNRRVHQS